VTDRQTDRSANRATRSVTAGCIYVRSTAMRPNDDSSIVADTTAAAVMSAAEDCCEVCLTAARDARITLVP